jgi:hypothetical protein
MSHFIAKPGRCSRRLLMVVMQEPTQSFTALHGPLAADVRIPREQQDIALSLMIPLSMEVFDIFSQRAPQRLLTKENNLGQTLVASENSDSCVSMV